MSVRSPRGRSSWFYFWAGKPLPPCPEDCPVAAYEEFRRHVAEGVTIAALARATGDSRAVVTARLDKTHRALHRPGRGPGPREEAS